jgi:hypothetical protein
MYEELSQVAAPGAALEQLEEGEIALGAAAVVPVDAAAASQLATVDSPPAAAATSPQVAAVAPTSRGLAPSSSTSADLDLRLASFRDRCRQQRAALLPKPAPKRPRKKRVPPSVVRRSRRVAGRFAAGTPIKQQQRSLMLQLGIAREGEVIGDEA